MSHRKGVFLAFLAALVSGASIFLNSFAVQPFDPFLFTSLKNVLVVVLLFAVFLFLKDLSSFKLLKRKHWLQLALIGLIGGSIPFLLFFYALSLTTVVNAAFIHKLLFLFVTALAVVFLKERFSKKIFFGAVLLLSANILLFGINVVQFTFIDLLILTATVFWAAENVISKRVLKELSGLQVAFGRMFFGSLFLFGFLFFTGRIELIPSLSLSHFFWVFLTAGFLFAYVLFWYSGLKLIPASTAASILLIGLPVTATLNAVFLGKSILPLQALAFLLLFLGITFFLSPQKNFSSLKTKPFG